MKSTATEANKCLYDGGNTIAEHTQSSNLHSADLYTWGLSPSGALQDDGRIGGLLAIRDRGTNYYLRTDGKGNVTEARWSNGTVRASYTYAPFGALLTQTNTYNQPVRFQSKLHHPRSGLSYFGYRWYDPHTGRWLSRDGLGEAGGINLYVYCANNPVNFIDPLGLAYDVIGIGPSGMPTYGPERDWGAYDHAFGGRGGARQVPSGWGEVLRWSYEWASGTGPDNRILGPDSDAAYALRHSLGVQRAREQFNACGRDNLSTWHDFLAYEFLWATLNNAGYDHFMGSYAVDMVRTPDGGTSFTVWNETSVGSLLRYTRSSKLSRITYKNGRGHTVRQTVSWTEYP